MRCSLFSRCDWTVTRKDPLGLLEVPLVGMHLQGNGVSERQAFLQHDPIQAFRVFANRVDEL